MSRKAQAEQLKDNPLLDEILGTWRRDIIDAMLVEPDPAERENLWRKQFYLTELTESIESELNSILSGRESES